MLLQACSSCRHHMGLLLLPLVAVLLLLPLVALLLLLPLVAVLLLLGVQEQRVEDSLGAVQGMVPPPVNSAMV
jgi:hypothetical protein